MKTKKLFLAMLAALIICPVFTACGDDEDPAEKNPTEKEDNTDKNNSTEKDDTSDKDDNADKDKPSGEDESGDKKDETRTYFLEYVFSNDFLALYDVKVTKTVGTTQTVYSFSKDRQVTDETGSWSGKSTGTDKVELNKETALKVEADIKLKSNWKDIIASKDEIVLMMAKSVAESEKSMTLEPLGGPMQTDKVYVELLEAFATSFTENIKLSK